MAKYRTKLDVNWSFANIRLTADQRNHFLEWVVEASDRLLDVIELIGLAGYKLSLRWDGENTTWIATLSGTDVSAHNDKVSMSARHSDLQYVILLVAYKHIVVCEEGIWSEKAPDQEWG